MTMLKRFLASLIVALGLGGASMPAQAGCCVFDSASIVAAIQAAQTAIVNTIVVRSEVMRISVTKAIQGSTQILAREEARGAALVSETFAQVETGLETARNESAWKEVDVCGVLAPTMGPSEAIRGSAGLGGGVGRGGGGGGGTGHL